MKYIFILILFIIISVIAVFLPYRYVFSGELSQSSADWAAFGSYLSGTLGPTFSFFSIIAVILVSNFQIGKAKSQLETEIKESKNQLDKQLKEQRRIEYIKSLEQRAQSILDLMIIMITEKRSQHRILLKYVRKIGGSSNVSIQQRDKYYALINEKNNLEYYLEYSNVFSIYLSYRSEFGQDSAYKDLIENDACGFLNDYKTFSNSAIYLLQTIKSLLNENYDLHLVRHMLSQPFDALVLLNEINIFPENSMQLIRHIMSCPLDQSPPLKFNIYGVLINEYNRIYDTEYKIDDFEFDNELSIDTKSSLFEYHFRIKTIDKEFKYSTSNGFSSLN